MVVEIHGKSLYSEGPPPSLFLPHTVGLLCSFHMGKASPRIGKVLALLLGISKENIRLGKRMLAWAY